MKAVSKKKVGRSVRAQAKLKKERGVWVYEGKRGKVADESLQEQIDAVRERRKL